MDPTLLASSVTTLLVPFLLKAAEKAFEKIGEQLPGQAGKLWEAIINKFKGKPAAEDAVKDLVAKPQDADTQASFRKEIKKIVEADLDFATQLEKLLQAAQSNLPAAGSVINTGSGAVATHGSVAAGEGGVAIGGDVTGDINIGASKKRV